MKNRKKVILITDGDKLARKTVETVAKNIGGCCISRSGGNPTPISGEEIVKLIKSAHAEPVLVMLDDRGDTRKGKGETALEYIFRHPDIEVLGAVAVASNSCEFCGIPVAKSITCDGKIVDGPVDKEGNAEPRGHKWLEGDTVDILNKLEIPVVIGIGDIGKMSKKDYFLRGAPITTKAVEFILQRSGYFGE